MDLERLLPLLILWIIWRILTNRRKVTKEKAGPPPVFLEKESEAVEPGRAAAVPPPPLVSVTEAEEQAIVSTPVTSSPAMPGGRARQGMMEPDRSFLQQAVVWAEILAPPVGLRDSASSCARHESP
jgi:hypothetical protein